METPKCKDYSQFYSDCWNKAVEDKNYEEALNYAMKGYLIAKDIGDEVFRKGFLGLLRTNIHLLIDKSLDKHAKEAEQGHCCSFCGRKANEVKLMAGALGSICQECANRVHQYFTQGK